MGGVSVSVPVKYFSDGDEFDWKAWVAPLEYLCAGLGVQSDLKCSGIITSYAWNNVIDTVYRCASRLGYSRRIRNMPGKGKFETVTSSDINLISSNIEVLLGAYS